MKLPLFTTLLLATFIFNGFASAQQRKPSPVAKARSGAAKSAEVGQTAIVVDETLSVLRVKPSLFSDSIQRMRRGRKVQILGVAEADGVKFYRVPAREFWMGSGRCRFWQVSIG